MTMKCITCKKPMITVEYDRIEVDYCLDCGGVWLDAGELELLLGSADEIIPTLRKKASGDRQAKSVRKCPICGKRMEEIRIGREPGVPIDICKRDHGIWFDRGELEKVTEILGEGSGKRVSILLKNIFGHKNN
jgi:Zn-finger nucleic acid-binding protein